MPDEYYIKVKSADGKEYEGTADSEKKVVSAWGAMKEKYGQDCEITVGKNGIDKNDDATLDPEKEYQIYSWDKNGGLMTGSATGRKISEARGAFDETYGKDGWIIGPEYYRVTPRLNTETGAVEGFDDWREPTNTETFFNENGSEYRRLGKEVNKPEYKALRESDRSAKWRVPMGMGGEPVQPEDDEKTTEMWKNIDRYNELKGAHEKAREDDRTVRRASETDPEEEAFNNWRDEYGDDLVKAKDWMDYERQLSGDSSINIETMGLPDNFQKLREKYAEMGLKTGEEVYKHLANEYERYRRSASMSKSTRAKIELMTKGVDTSEDERLDAGKQFTVHSTSRGAFGSPGSIPDISSLGTLYYDYKNGKPDGWNENPNAAMANLDIVARFNADTKRILTANPNSFWSGGGYFLKNPNSYIANIPESIDHIKIRLLIDKLEKPESEGGGPDSLTKDEQMALGAWQRNAEAHMFADPLLSNKFKAGQAAAQSVEFMVEMALTGGIVDAVEEGALRAALKKWASKGVVEGIERGVARKSVDSFGEGLAKYLVRNIEGKGKKFLAEQGVNAVRAIPRSMIQTALNVPMQLRSLGDNLLAYDEEGNLPSWGKAIGSSEFQTWVETYTENGIAPIWNVLTKYPTSLAGEAMRSLLPKAYNNLMEMYTKARVSGFGRLLRASGFQGLNEEVAEELAGALIYAIGGNSDELKDFFTRDNLVTLYLSFLPMTLLGGGVSMAQVGMAARNYNNQRAGFSKMLGDIGFNDEQIKTSLDGILSDPTQGHLGLLQTIFELAGREGMLDESGQPMGKWAQLLDKSLEFRAAAAQKAVYDGAWESEQNEQMRAEYEKIDKSMGNDFLYRGTYTEQGQEGTQFSADENGEAEAIRQGEEMADEVQDIAEEMADTEATPETRKERRERKKAEKERKKEERRARREQGLEMSDDERAQRTIDSGRVCVVRTTDGREVYVLGRAENGEWAVKDTKGGEMTFISDDQIERGDKRGDDGKVVKDEDGNAQKMTAEETVKANTQSLKQFLGARLLYNKEQRDASLKKGLENRANQVRSEQIQQMMDAFYKNGQWGGTFGKRGRYRVADAQTDTGAGLFVYDGKSDKPKLMEWKEIYNILTGDELANEGMAERVMEEQRRAERGELPTPQEQQEAKQEEEQSKTPLQKLPKDKNGDPIFERAESPAQGLDALIEAVGGDAERAFNLAMSEADDATNAAQEASDRADKAAKTAEEAKTKPKGNSMSEKIAYQNKVNAEAERTAKEADAAAKRAEFWTSVVEEAKNRRIAQQNAQSQTQQAQQQSENTQTESQQTQETPQEQTQQKPQTQQKRERRKEEKKEGKRTERDEQRERDRKEYNEMCEAVRAELERLNVPYRLITSKEEFLTMAKAEGEEFYQQIRSMLNHGMRTYGFARKGAVWIYAPQIFDDYKGEARMDKAKQTIAHEAIAHIGLKNMKDAEKKGGFVAFCKDVYGNVMSEKDRERYLAYQWNINMTEEARRAALGMKDKEGKTPRWEELTAEQRNEVFSSERGESVIAGAADEYIAGIAEKIERGEAISSEERTVWQRFIDWLAKKFGVKMTEHDVVDALLEAKRGIENTQTETAENKGNEVAERGEVSGEEARKAGKWTVDGYEYTRQESHGGIQGAETEVVFGEKNGETKKGRYVLVPRSGIQASHTTDGQRNPMHFIPEAQPKDRSSADSGLASGRIASNLDPERVTTGKEAYVGAPVINTRGEVIQGNNRTIGMQKADNANMETYHNWLREHAEEFGFTPEQVDQMGDCVLAREIDVDDKTAIELGQRTAQDTESGGKQAIDPSRVSQGLQSSGNLGGFVETLLADTGDEGASLTDTIRENAKSALSLLYSLGLVNDTQLASAYNSSGEINAETVKALNDIAQSVLFEGGNLALQDDFKKLPNNVKNALLQTMWRTVGKEGGKEAVREIQEAVRAYRIVSDVNEELKGTRDIDKIRNIIRTAFVQGDMFNGRSDGQGLSREAQMMAERFYLAGKGLLYSPNGTKLKLKDVMNRVLDNMEGRMTMFEEREPMSYSEAVEEAFNSDPTQRFSAEEREERQFEETRFMVAADLKNDPVLFNLAEKYWHDGMAARVNDAKTIDELNTALNDMCDKIMDKYCKRKAVVTQDRARGDLANLQMSHPAETRKMVEDLGIQYRQDTEKYTDDEIKKIVRPAEDKLTEIRREAGTQWDDALSDYPPAMRYMALKSLWQFIRNETEASPIQFLEGPFRKTMERFSKTDNPIAFNFYNEYNKAILEEVGEDEGAITVVDSENGISGTWVKVHRASESDDVEKSKAKAAAASNGTQWCTRYAKIPGTGATKVLEEDDHDMYFFFPKGSTQAQIAVVPIRPGEEEQLRNNQWYTGIFKRTNASDNSIEPNLFDAVNGLARQTGDDNLAYTLDKIGYKGLSKEEYEELHRSNVERAREFINSRSTFTADDIDEIYDLFGIQLKVDGDRLVLHELDAGVWYQVYDSLGQNGVVEEDADELTHNFWTAMLNSVREIEGDCVLEWGDDTLGTVEYIGGNLEMEAVYSLGNLKRVEGDVNLAGANDVSGEENLLGGLEYVGGDLDLSGSQITSLGNVQHVGGELLLERSGVTSLGNLNYVGSLPDIGRSSVTDMGALEVVNGDANFRSGRVNSLGKLREIWGIANFKDSTLEDLGALEFVGNDVLLEGVAVGTLGNLKRVIGDLNIEYTGVEDLGALEYVGDNAKFSGSLIKSMGKLKHIGGNLEITECDNLTTLGNLEGIDGGFYVGFNDALKNTGKLKMVGGNVSFIGAQAISLDEQKAFAYRANIGGTITFSDKTKIEGKDTRLDLRFSAEERELSDAGTRFSAEEREAVDELRSNGVEVITDTAETERVLDEMREEGGTRFLVAGERGVNNLDRTEALMRLNGLELAKRMREESVDPQKIKVATGWEIGADGMWKHEIHDPRLNWKEIEGKGKPYFEAEKIPLEKVLVGADELFKMYPQLRDIKLVEDTLMRLGGEYNHNKKEIRIYGSSFESFHPSDGDTQTYLENRRRFSYSTLLHEIQHAIQYIEGFAEGGVQTLNFGDKKKLSELKSQWINLEYELALLEDLLHTYSEEEPGGERMKSIVQDEKDRVKEELNKTNDEIRETNDYREVYTNIAGEVEARNVSDRMKLSDTERLNTLLESTEDVARKDQIVIKNGVLYEGINTSLSGIAQSLQTSDGEMYGFVKDGKVYLGPNAGSIPASEWSRMVDTVMQEREESNDDQKATVSDIENPEGDTRFSATERVNAADEARERFGVELTPDDLASTSTKHGAMMKALRIATENGAIPNMDSTELLSFLSDTWRNAPDEVKSSIWETFSESADPDIAREVEQSLAEYVSREVRGVELTDAQRTFLDGAAKTIADRLGISEDNAKYVLWQHVNADNGITTDAERLAMQNALGVTTPASDYEAGVQAETRFSAADEQGVESAREMYEKAMGSIRGALSETGWNEYRALDDLVEAVSKQTGIKYNAWDPRKAFNQLTSNVKAATESYIRDYLLPMWDTIKDICGKRNVSADDLAEYVSLKHGLERNKVLYERDCAEAEKAGRKRPERSDYSGLTEWITDKEGYKDLTDLDEIEAAAQEIVDKYERTLVNSANALWDAIRAATRETLREQLRNGLISREMYYRISSMFEYYVPLQGFAGKTNEDKYEYMGGYHDGRTGTVGKRAKGRKSRATNPFVRIGTNAERTIREAELNRAKNALYNFLLANSDNDLTSFGSVWYVKTNEKDERDREIWNVSMPNLTDDMSAEELEGAIRAWESDMAALEEQGLAKREADRFELGENVAFMYNQDIPQHCIDVFVNGRRERIYIKGNPRAAQAVNGLLRTRHPDLERIFKSLSRYCSNMFTSNNPQFFVSNFSRDLGFATFNVFSKEGIGYLTRFIGNAVRAAQIGVLSSKYKSGNANTDRKMQRLYSLFAQNGGITGYSQIRSDKYYQKEMERELGRGHWLWKALTFIPESFRRITEDGENLLRFAAFLTSYRDGEGKSLTDSIADAKDVTVNFNRKGTGRMISAEEAERLIPGKGKGVARLSLRAASALLSVGPAFSFFNVSMQGMAQLFRNIKQYPQRAVPALVGMVGMGLLNGIIHGCLNAAMGNNPPDPDDPFYNIPDWERRSNYIIMLGNGNYIKIPISQELRPFYALGDMIGCALAHKTTQKDMELEFLSLCGEMLPINPLGEGGLGQSLAPTILSPVVDLLINRDYRGLTIIPDTYGDAKAKWQHSYGSTPDWAVEASRAINGIYPMGNMPKIDRKQFRKEEGWKAYYNRDRGDSAGWRDISPEAVQHLAEGYLGGLFTFSSMCYETAEAAIKGEDVNMRRVPFVNRFYARPSDRETGAYLLEMNRYAKKLYKNEEAKMDWFIKQIAEDRDNGEVDRYIDTAEMFVAALYSGFKDNLDKINRKMSSVEDEWDRKVLIDCKNEMLTMLAQWMEEELYDNSSQNTFRELNAVGHRYDNEVNRLTE